MDFERETNVDRNLETDTKGRCRRGRNDSAEKASERWKVIGDVGFVKVSQWIC